MTDRAELFEIREPQTVSSSVFEDIKPAIILRGGLYMVEYHATFKACQSGVFEARLVYNDGIISTSYGSTQQIVIQGSAELSGFGQGLLKFQIRAIRGSAQALLTSFLVAPSGASTIKKPQLAVNDTVVQG
jgi:hypothetical protein